MQKYTYLILILLICSCKPNDSKNNTTNDDILPNEQIINKVDSVDTKSVKIDTLSTPEKIDIKESIPVEKRETLPPKPKEPVVVKKSGSLHIENPVFDFGRVVEGAIVEHVFEIENKGDASLHITDVEVDCGCTVPEYTKEGIPPGGKESIKVTFDTKGKLASQMRYITIYTDGKPLSKLVRLKGMVSTE